VGVVGSPVSVGVANPLQALNFSALGLLAPAGTQVDIRGQCQDENGARVELDTLWSVAAARMLARWMPDEVAALTGGPIAPAPLGTLRATVVMAGLSVPPDYTRWFSCVAAVLSPGTPDPPSAEPLSQAFATASPLSLSFGFVAAVCDNTTGGIPPGLLHLACWQATFQSLTLEAAPFGASLTLAAECTWIPTGERLRLPSLNVSTAVVTAQWVLPQPAVRAPGSGSGSGGSSALTVPLFLQAPVLLTAIVANDLTPSLWATANGRCVLSAPTGGVLRLEAAAARQQYDITSAAMAAGFNVTVLVEGMAGTTLTVRLDCTFWDRPQSTVTLLLVAQNVHLAPVGALPVTYIPSDGASWTPLSPPPAFRFTDDDGAPVTDILCSLNTNANGAEVRRVPDTGRLVPDAYGIINVTNTLITTTFAVTHIDLIFTCWRAAGDAPPAYAWAADLVPLRMSVCTPPATEVNKDGLLPPWGVGFDSPAGPACNAAAFPQPIAGVVSCDIIVSVTTAASTANETTSSGPIVSRGFVEHGRAANVPDDDGRLVFHDAVLLGTRGTPYNFSVLCSLGTITMPGSYEFSVSLAPCQAGTSPSSLFCLICAAGTYTRGNNEQTCLSCPIDGATCLNGNLTLLPNYFRSLADNDAPVTSDTQLYPCYNDEACTLNVTATNPLYRCATGYTGPLCGVCDAAANYGQFGGGCKLCWPTGVTVMLLVLLILLFVAFLTFIGMRRGNDNESTWRIVLKMMLGFFQALSSIRVFKASGTAMFREAMSWSDSASSSPLSSGLLQCYLNWSLLTSFVVTILLPAIAAGGCLLIVATILASRNMHWRTATFNYPAFRDAMRGWLGRRRHVSTLVFMLFVGYMPIVSAAFRILGCYARSIDGNQYLLSDLRVTCHVGQHAVATVIAVVVLAGFGAGFPATLYFLLSRATPQQLADTHFRAAFSFLFQGYRVGASVATALAPNALLLSDVGAPAKQGSRGILSQAPAAASRTASSAADMPPPGDKLPAPGAIVMSGGSAIPLGGVSARGVLVSMVRRPSLRVLAGGSTRDARLAALAAEQSRSLVWWEAVILVRKAGVVSFATVLNNPFYQVVCATLLFSGSILLQHRYRPFTQPLYNALEMLVLLDLYVTAAASVLMLPNAVGASSKSGDNSAYENFVTAGLIILNFSVGLLLLGVFFRQCAAHSRLARLVAACTGRGPASAAAAATPSPPPGAAPLSDFRPPSLRQLEHTRLSMLLAAQVATSVVVVVPPPSSASGPTGGKVQAVMVPPPPPQTPSPSAVTTAGNTSARLSNHLRVYMARRGIELTATTAGASSRAAATTAAAAAATAPIPPAPAPRSTIASLPSMRVIALPTSSSTSV